MKKIAAILLVSLFLLGYRVKSQDMIFLQRGDLIKAKITEVNEKNVSYKLYDHPTGPLYQLYTYQIATIRYEDGSVKIFHVNMRKNLPWGLTFNYLGTSITFGASVEYFFHPSWAAEAGVDLIGAHAGLRHHFLGKTEKQWTPYIGVYTFAYTLVFFNMNGFYFPIGLHSISKKGFTFSAEAGIMNARIGSIFSYYKPAIIFPFVGVKAGFRLGKK